MSFLIGILTVVHVLVALFVILLVLMQKSSEQGVGAAFGGGVTETVFGAGTTTALVRLTIWCACLLLATTLILAVLHSHHAKPTGSLMHRLSTTTPAGPAAGQPPAFPTASQPAMPPVSEPGNAVPAPVVPQTAEPAPSPATTPAPAPPSKSP